MTTGSGAAIDVLVPTRDRPEDLARCLGSLAAQDIDELRCLVIDQSDEPDVNRRLIDELADPRIEHLVDHSRGKSRALNLGLRATTAPVVAFTDDDCTMAPDWLARGRRSLDRPNVGVVFGLVTAAPHDPAAVYIPEVSFDGVHTVDRPLFRSPGLIGMGADMFIDREVLERIGGFDEDLGPGGRLFTGEDCEIAYRALRHGFAVKQDPGLEVVHWGARPLEGHVARDLVTTAFFAIGAGYGKHARDRDVRALAVALDELGAAVAASLAALVRRRGPYHVRRITRFVQGFVAGVRSGPCVPAVDPAPSSTAGG